MRLIEKEIIRDRDFTGTYECEHCGHVEKRGCGYDDDFYHTKVIPAMYCKKCGKNRGGLTETQKNPPLKIKRLSLMSNHLGLMGACMAMNKGIVSVYEANESITICESLDHISIKNHKEPLFSETIDAIKDVFFESVKEEYESDGVVYIYGTILHKKDKIDG